MIGILTAWSNVGDEFLSFLGKSVVGEVAVSGKEVLGQEIASPATLTQAIDIASKE
jgi:hypothetical protein